MTPDTRTCIESSGQQGVWHIHINRPGKRNALTMPMFQALAESLQQADLHEDMRSILVTSAADVFCAGHDLEAFEQWPQQPHDPVPSFLHAIADVRKPVVIAVQGAATGIGVTWLLHADWVVADAAATLRLPFVDLGIVPEAASTALLQQAVGSARAKRLLLGGEKFTGQQAYDWGLVAELAPTDAIMATAWQRAQLLAAKNPVIARRIKDWLHPAGAHAERIDAEISQINAAIVLRRQTA